MCQQLVLVIVCAHPKDQWQSETYEFDRRYVVSYQIVDRWTIYLNLHWPYIQFYLCMKINNRTYICFIGEPQKKRDRHNERILHFKFTVTYFKKKGFLCKCIFVEKVIHSLTTSHECGLLASPLHSTYGFCWWFIINIEANKC